MEPSKNCPLDRPRERTPPRNMAGSLRQDSIKDRFTCMPAVKWGKE